VKRRASSAPIHAKCPASAYGAEDSIRLNRIDGYSAFGSAVHEAAAAIVQEKEFDTAELFARHQLAESEKGRFMGHVGRIFRWWSEYGAGFITDDGTLRVLDWKTTRLLDVDYSAQLMEYLWLSIQNSPLATGMFVEQQMSFVDLSGHTDVVYCPSELKGCQYIIVFTEDGSQIVSPVLSAKDVIDCHLALDTSLLEWDGQTYHPGGHCWYCPRAAACPGVRHEIAQCMYPSLEQVEQAVAQLDDNGCVEMWDRVGMAIKFLERAREAIKLRAVGSENRLAGHERDLIVEERKQHPLNALKAWPILTRHLSDTELAPAVSISKTVAMAAISAKCARGQKKAAIARVTAELEAAGALEERTILFPKIVPSLAASGKEIPLPGE
jgi:hypothetical protein